MVPRLLCEQRDAATFCVKHEFDSEATPALRIWASSFPPATAVAVLVARTTRA
jgi:hypothetical protein